MNPVLLFSTFFGVVVIVLGWQLYIHRQNAKGPWYDQLFYFYLVLVVLFAALAGFSLLFVVNQPYGTGGWPLVGRFFGLAIVFLLIGLPLAMVNIVFKFLWNKGNVMKGLKGNQKEEEMESRFVLKIAILILLATASLMVTMFCPTRYAICVRLGGAIDRFFGILQ